MFSKKETKPAPKPIGPDTSGRKRPKHDTGECRTKHNTPYETEEGCLSLSGVRKTTRYQNIELEYLDSGWIKHRQEYSGKIAQIIQHEVDHLEGIII